MTSVSDYIRENQEHYLEELKEFLRIPSISALPEHRKDIEHAVRFLSEHMKKIGLTRVEAFQTPGNPIVYGEWSGAPGAPTILVYAHYDVQPVDPLDLWHSPPFEPVVRDGRLYARGSADDKGQMFIHFKAVEAHLKQNGRLPVNIKFIIEGEEEVGSTHLDEFVEQNGKLLKCDVVVISDTSMFARGVPSICVGLRGLAYYQLDVTGPKSDLHSGQFGGTVFNPGQALCRILAQMKDDDGRVTIPGFYDAVRSLTAEERAEIASLPFNDEAYRKSLGAPALFGEKGFSTLERIWARPTFEVNGLLCGFTGEGPKTVLPSKAMAKVSMRLVPDQTPEKIGGLFEDYVRKLCPAGADLKITPMHGGRAWLAPLDHPILQAASRAVERGFGKRPVFTREGGSIPIVATFQELLKVPSILMGIGLPDDNLHAPNEKLDLENFFGGILSAAYLLEEVAKAQ